MTKALLRDQYKQKRLALAVNEKDKLEDLILIQFQQLNIDIPALIMTYAPFVKHNEFNPQSITDYCYFKHPHQSLFYPVIDTGNEMNCVVVNDHTVFQPNMYGIDEPVDGLQMFPEEIDLVLVPLLAFDERGHRVGYGKGYYDRFLKKCRRDVVRVGFSFFEAEKKIMDTDKFDIKLNYCVTPTRCYEF